MKKENEKTEDSTAAGACDDLDPKYLEIKDSGVFGALFEMFSPAEVVQLDRAGSEFSSAMEKFKTSFMEAMKDPEKRREFYMQMEKTAKPQYKDVHVDAEDG